MAALANRRNDSRGRITFLRAASKSIFNILLPLIPLGIGWFFTSRSRENLRKSNKRLQEL